MDLSRAPDQMSAAAAMVWAWSLSFVPRFGAAVLILVAGIFLAGWATRLVSRMSARTIHLDPTVRPFLGTIVRYGVLILFLIAALGQLGVQTASLLAVLGAAGLAIGLALQGTLQNIAAGIMLIYLRPFHVGDYIETPTIAGSVREIGLFATHLETGDGLFYFVPNSALWNAPLKNHNRNPRRLMTIRISIDTGADPAEARRILLGMAADDPRILADPPPSVFVENYGDGAVVLAFTAWAPTPLFWEAQRATIEEAKRRLESGGIDMPFPQRIVHVVTPAANPGGPSSAKGQVSPKPPLPPAGP
jgi:small conductance mechanosensitive channel